MEIKARLIISKKKKNRSHVENPGSSINCSIFCWLSTYRIKVNENLFWKKMEHMKISFTFTHLYSRSGISCGTIRFFFHFTFHFLHEGDLAVFPLAHSIIRIRIDVTPLIRFVGTPFALAFFLLFAAFARSACVFCCFVPPFQLPHHFLPARFPPPCGPSAPDWWAWQSSFCKCKKKINKKCGFIKKCDFIW